VLIVISIALVTVAAGVPAGDVTDNTQSAVDVMTSLLSWRHAGAAAHRQTDRRQTDTEWTHNPIRSLRSICDKK